MNASQLAQAAYAPTAAPIRTDRGTEYQAFAQITARIRAAHQKGRSGFGDLVLALHENRRLWTLLASDVASQNNTLPERLRAQIFYLAEFTQAHTSKVLAKTASPLALVEINTAMMRGLAPAQAAA